MSLPTSNPYQIPWVPKNEAATIGLGALQVLTFANPLNVDCRKSSQFSVSLTNDTVLNLIDAQDGQLLAIFLTQAAGGSHLVTWTDVLWHSGTPPTLTTTAGHTDYVLLQWNATLAKWVGILVVLDIS